MGRIFNTLVKVAAVLGVAVAAKKLSEKEKREAVKEEFNKAKEDPKSYAEDLQVKVSEKANEYQDKAVEEYNKVKEDPKGYAENVRDQAKQKADDVADYASKSVDKIKNNGEGDNNTATPDGEDISTELDEEKFQSEGNVHPDEAPPEETEEEPNIHVVTKEDNNK